MKKPQFKAAYALGMAAVYPADKMDAYIEHLLTRAEAAEAKLAELEKQEAAGKFAFEPLAERYHHIKHGEAQHMEPKLPLVKLFTRPATAINLAELVPDGRDLVAEKQNGFYERAIGWNECCAATLRNIEEAKTK